MKRRNSPDTESGNVSEASNWDTGPADAVHEPATAKKSAHNIMYEQSDRSDLDHNEPIHTIKKKLNPTLENQQRLKAQSVNSRLIPQSDIARSELSKQSKQTSQQRSNVYSQKLNHHQDYSRPARRQSPNQDAPLRKSVMTDDDHQDDRSYIQLDPIQERRLVADTEESRPRKSCEVTNSLSMSPDQKKLSKLQKVSKLQSSSKEPSPIVYDNHLRQEERLKEQLQGMAAIGKNRSGSGGHKNIRTGDSFASIGQDHDSGVQSPDRPEQSKNVLGGLENVRRNKQLNEEKIINMQKVRKNSSEEEQDATETEKNSKEIAQGWGGAGLELGNMRNYEKQFTKVYDGEDCKNKKLAGLMASGVRKLRTSKSLNTSQSKRRLGFSSASIGGEDEEEDDFMNESFGQDQGVVEEGKKAKIKLEDQRTIFIKEYGVQIEIPAYYYVDAKFVPHYINHIITMSFHIIPKDFGQSIQTTFMDGSVEENSFSEIYQMTGRSIILSLMIDRGRQGFEKAIQIQLPEVRKALTLFSRSGKYFGIFLKQDNILHIFDSSDIYKCFDDIKKQNPLMMLHVKNENFGTAHRIIFDKHDKYVAVVSPKAIIIVSLMQGSMGQIVQEYQVDIEKYTGLFDIILDSEGATHEDQFKQYKCMIACKKSGITSVCIFDINNDQDNRIISYMVKGDNLVVKISDDLKKVILSNGLEHYMHNGHNQENFPWIKDKFLRNVINHGESFYLVTSKDYDRDIDILHSQDQEFNVSIKRSIEPGLLVVYDSIIMTKGVDSQEGHLKILTNLGDRLYLDTLDIDLGYRDDPTESVIQTCIDSNYGAYGFNWPYFSYGTSNCKVFIYNSFNPQFIQRYELPPHVNKIVYTFLTDTHDFFCMVETKDKFFEKYHIDLDSPNPTIQGPLLKYSFENVGNLQLTGYHVRGSSHKEKINLNKALITFMLHENQLYAWKGKSGNQIELVSKNASNLYYLSDDQVFFMTTQQIQIGEKTVEHSSVKMLDALFGSYTVRDIYEDKDIRSEILNFGVDNTRRRLIILTGIKNNKNRRDKFITLFEIDRQKLIYQLQTKSREIIGRLKSNLYNFVEGHIYYGNKVIKIRYDLLEKMKGGEIKENQLFDHYDSVLSLQNKNNQVQSGTPLQTCLYNRLAYIVRNEKELKPKRILILPYLHERRIYLNRRHYSNQFYTILSHDNQKYILCICINDSKTYIYTETGILVDRKLYRDEAVRWGKPVSISEDGRNLIFRRSDQSSELFLVKVMIDGLHELKKVHIKDTVQKYLKQLKKENPENYPQIIKYWDVYLNQCRSMKHVRIIFCLNDDSDILMQIKPTDEFLKKKEKEMKDLEDFHDEEESIKSLKKSSFFFFLANENHPDGQLKGEFLFFNLVEENLNYDIPQQPLPFADKEGQEIIYDLKGVSMNQKYVFFHNLGKAWKLDLFSKKLSRLQLYISEQEEQTWIKKMRTGSNKNIVAIRVEQSPKLDCIIIWDLHKDQELSSFDVDSNALYFQDSEGNPFLAEKDYILNCNQGCKLKCYNLRVGDFNRENIKFGFQYGHRVETDSHNWIIFRNFINLSFSYMTFVIKENFDKQGYIMEDYLFDIEGYDYVLHKNTMFTQNKGFLVTRDFEKLSFILKSYEKLDPNLLESLHYKTQVDGKDKIPLHFALEANNNRVINILLNYMSKIPYAAVNHIQDIFKLLINYQSFEKYLIECPFQTVQMINKQTLKFKKLTNEEIVMTTPTKCSYVDEDFFNNEMGEKDCKEGSLTYAVKMQCVKADWIVNTQNGLIFLKELLKQQNKDIFMTPYIEIVIEFLYNQFRDKIMQNLLPPYILHLAAIQATIWVSELHRKESDLPIEEQKFDILSTLVLLMNCVILVVNMFTFGRQSMHLRQQVFKRMWSIMDIVILSCNLFIVMRLFFPIRVDILRIFEATLTVFIWFKSLYFFRLVGEIAPLVEIIIVILGDIKYFMIIFIIGLIAFVQAFMIIGQNQDPDTSYNSLMGSLDHVYKSALGEFDTDQYYDNEMTPVLIILFVGLSFFMCLHLLNMLIAIMGESFAQNNENKEAKKKMSQLAFVVDNWWIDPIKNKEKIVYLIAAFQIKDDDDDEEKFEMINENIDQLKMMVSELINEVQNINEVVYNLNGSLKMVKHA